MNERKIIEYQLIVVKYRDIFNVIINEHITEGWQPFKSHIMEGEWFSQAMVKYETTKVNNE